MRKGEKMSEEQRLKVSLNRKGKGLGNTNRKNQAPSHKGKKLPKEWRERLSLAKKGKISNYKGKKTSLEIRSKQSLARRDYLKRMNPQYEFVPNPTDHRKWVRRERMKRYGGYHSVGEWENLKAQYNWTCPNCRLQEPEITLTRDHIIPVAIGGSDNIENIQPLCKKCNSLKGTIAIKY